MAYQPPAVQSVPQSVGRVKSDHAPQPKLSFFDPECHAQDRQETLSQSDPKLHFAPSAGAALAVAASRTLGWEEVAPLAERDLASTNPRDYAASSHRGGRG